MSLDPHKIPLHRNRVRESLSLVQLLRELCNYICILLVVIAPRTAGEMQNTQQTHGTVDAAAVEVAAAPPKKLGRKVVVVAARITGHKGKGDEYHRCKPHSETNED